MSAQEASGRPTGRPVLLGGRLRDRLAVVVTPARALTALVVLLAGGLVLLASRVPGPDVFLDEFFYMEMGTSLANGAGFAVRGVTAHLPGGYPVLVALGSLLSDDRSGTYALGLMLNGAIVATVPVPVYLLARRLVGGWASLAAAAATAALPFSFYAGYLMSDVLGLAVALWAVLAMQRCLERPTWARQAVALGAIAAAVLVRYQYVALAPALVLGLALRLVLERRRPTLRRALAAGAPIVATAVVAIAAVVLVALASGRGLGAVLGNYGALWRSYDPADVGRWLVYDVLEVALYLVVVPVVLAPGIALVLRRRIRGGDRAAAAFAALLVSVGLTALATVAVFSSTEFAGGRYHDRYLAYAFPLAVVALAVWAADGAPVRRRASAVVGLGLCALALVVPLESLLRWDGSTLFDAPGTTPWALVGEIASADGLTLRVVVAVAFALLVALALAGRRGTRLALGLGVLACLLTTAGMWSRTIDVGGRGVFAGSSAEERLWVDRAAAGRPVTMLYHVGPGCSFVDTRSAFFVTEFFDESVGPVVTFAEPMGDNLPETRARRGADGTLTDAGGEAVTAQLVLAPPSVTLAGRQIARGTTSDLRVWQVDGPIRVTSSGRCPAR